MLVIKSLSFAFQHRRLFSDLSLEIKPGEVLHLTGPNGAGKSTLISILSGVREQTSGTIQYFNSNGIEVEDRREHIEYLVSEANGLYGKIDATENLKFWGKLRGYSHEDELIERTLKHWGIGHILVRQGFAVEKFSTGMRRRLALARVQLSQTPLWLLDEPIYGLDTKGISLFQEMIRSHKKNGGSIIIISHDTDCLEGLITHTHNLQAGQ